MPEFKCFSPSPRISFEDFGSFPIYKSNIRFDGYLDYFESPKQVFRLDACYSGNACSFKKVNQKSHRSVPGELGVPLGLGGCQCL